MSLRLKRLAADYERVRLLFQGEARITLIEHHGKPPERYVLNYEVRSLQEELESKTLKWSDSFKVEISLPSSYPRTAPQCRMLTPVFHPNIAPHAICIGDHWAAGESLANLIVRIGEMLAYQSYNVKSPLNGHAAQWAEQNRQRLPVDTFDFSSILAQGEAVRASDETTRGACANCGARDSATHLQVCVNGHYACDACLVPCSRCGKPMCMACDMKKCGICSNVACANCMALCASCGTIACVKDATRCNICKEIHCRNCLVKCATCATYVCINHIVKSRDTNGTVYVCTNCANR